RASAARLQPARGANGGGCSLGAVVSRRDRRPECRTTARAAPARLPAGPGRARRPGPRSAPLRGGLQPAGDPPLPPRRVFAIHLRLREGTGAELGSFRRAVRDGPVLYEARTSAGRPAGIPLSPADQSNAHAPGGDDRDSGAAGIISRTTSPTIPPASSAVSMVTSSRFRSANRFVTSNDPAPATGPSLSSFNRTSAGPTTRSKTSRTVSAGARLLG